ncbi:MAG: hypothetical protein ACRCYP_01580 [Alphaproteobacteria bacterium]
MSEELARQVNELRDRLDKQAKLLTALTESSKSIDQRIEDSNQKLFKSLTDNINRVNEGRGANTQRIENIEIMLRGDGGDRNKGVLEELSEAKRHLEALLRIQEEWNGISGNEERPGVSTMVHRLWLEYRDRTTRGNYAKVLWTGGGLSVALIAFNLINGTVERSVKANNDRALATDNRIKTTESDISTIKSDVKVLYDRQNRSQITPSR